MTVASRAVMMAVRTEARAVDVEQEGHTPHWVGVLQEDVVAPVVLEVEVRNSSSPDPVY